MKKKISLCISLMFILLNLSAQDQNWVFVNENAVQKLNTPRNAKPQLYKTLLLSFDEYKVFLNRAPREKDVAIQNGMVISIPYPDQTFKRFRIVETKLMEDALAAKFPGIKTFVGQGIDDRTAIIRIDYTYEGFHAFVQSAEGNLFIDPYEKMNRNFYICYFSKDHNDPSRQNFECKVTNTRTARTAVLGATCIGGTLRTYRLAVACTGEYADSVCFPAPVTQVLVHSKIVTTVNRVVGVYEKELDIRMILVANNNNVEFINRNTDPFLGNDDPNTLIDESQRVIDSAIGNANYDIGHTFSTGAGGLAGLGVVCQTGDKALGITGRDHPYGDDYDIDYVAHEMGHQFGGNHTFNGVNGSCAGNGNNLFTSYEPGSGTTIQAYAGICLTDDIQPHSDPFFHTISFDEITEYVNFDAGNTCPVKTPTLNNPPVVTMPASGKVIPRNTPFMLTGSATDPNGDALTYCWEEFDAGIGSPYLEPVTPTTVTEPLFRSRVPKTSPTRVFPDLRVIIANYPLTPPAVMDGLKGEVLSQVSRDLYFRLTVRDNRAGGGGVATGGEGCSSTADFFVTVGADGPFVVTSPNTNVSYLGGSTQTVTWDVAGTNVNSPTTSNCQLVNILMSRDGGLTYPDTLVRNTPNDGTQPVVIPNAALTTARIMVKAADNYFFDISNANFTITPGPLPISLLSFSATAGKDNIKLDWSTSAEINSKAFEVLRSESNTGFTRIANLPAAGNSATGRNYSITDKTARKGVEYYYRLRQLDNDNREYLSSIEKAKIKDDGVFSFYVIPNPVKQQMQVVLNGIEDGPFSISLIDQLGKIILVKDFGKSYQGNVINFDMGKQPAGIYALKFVQNSKTKTIKVVRE